MQYSEFKDYAANLGRFATVREKAEEPSDRIVVQCYDGALVFVAGVDWGEAQASLKVLAGECATKGMAVIAARPFLTAAKALKGKGEVDFEITTDGVTMRTSVGGEIKLPNISTKVPKFIRATTALDGVAEVKDGLFGRAARIFDATLNKAYGAWNQVEFVRADSELWFRGGTSFEHTQFKVDTGGTYSELMWAALHPQFFNCIKDFEEGLLMWGREQMTVLSGPYFAVTNFMQRFPELPELPIKQNIDTKVVVDRKELVNAVKTIGGEKVFMAPAKGGITLAEWPAGKARLNLSAETSGQGRMATLGEMFTKLVTALGGEKVSIEWSSESSGPLWLEGRDGSAILGRVPLT